MHSTLLIAALSAVAPLASAADVFAHYMVQGLNADHAVEDVATALALGFDAFALNVGICDDSDGGWCPTAIQRLFDAAVGTDFKIFFSLDLYAAPDPYDFTTLINEYSAHDNYYRAGPDSYPMLSTFRDGGLGPSEWSSFLDDLDDSHFFVPMFDQSEGYYDDPEAFWSSWQATLNGTFSWEQSWPGQSDTHQNVTSEVDEELIGIAHNHDGVYMMGCSLMQYKNFQGDHFFRSGDITFPQRMEQILSLAEKPDFIQFQTWNDGGESHYIGVLREEGLTAEIMEYANQEDNDHSGLQPLVASFIDAFKTDQDASGMRPQNNSIIAGAMWHHEVLLTACGSDAAAGQGSAIDSVNWAVVLGDDATDWKVQVWSAGEMIHEDTAGPGLSYNSVPNIKAGSQEVKIIDASGTLVAEGGESTKDIVDGVDGICNLNFQVAKLDVVDGYQSAPASSTTSESGEVSTTAPSTDATSTEAEVASSVAAVTSSAAAVTAEASDSAVVSSAVTSSTSAFTSVPTTFVLSTSGSGNSSVTTTSALTAISTSSFPSLSTTATSVTTTASYVFESSSVSTAEPTTQSCGHHGHGHGHNGRRKRHHKNN